MYVCMCVYVFDSVRWTFSHAILPSHQSSGSLTMGRKWPGVACGQRTDPSRDSTGVPREGSFFTLPMGEPIGQIRLCSLDGNYRLFVTDFQGLYLQRGTVPVRPRREVWSCPCDCWQKGFGPFKTCYANRIADVASRRQMTSRRSNLSWSWNGDRSLFPRRMGCTSFSIAMAINTYRGNVNAWENYHHPSVRVNLRQYINLRLFIIVVNYKTYNYISISSKS